MSIKNLVLTASVILLSSCASQAHRGPASAEPNSESIDLASKLKNASFKFRATRDGDQVSLLGFVDVKMKACEAKVKLDSREEDGDNNSYVDCEIDLTSDPVRHPAHLIVKGNKRKFSASLIMEQENKYSLDIAVELAWENKQWVGSGRVYGWLNQRVGNNSNVTVTVRESLNFD